MSTAIDTAKVTNRRTLHFNDLDEIQADVEQLAKGRIRTLGNWTPGQLLSHLARLMNKSIDGFEAGPPWFIRLMGPLFFKPWVLNKGMAPGFQLKGKMAEELLCPATTPLEQGLDEFRRAVTRLKASAVRAPSPFLGKLTMDEWTRLHCRHAELHLSFLVPG
jgi:hypothetical protein